MFNPLRWVTSLPVGSPVVVLPPFSLWTDVFCSFPQWMMEQLCCCDSVPVASLVRAGCAMGR